MVPLLNEILADAVEARATDVHFEAQAGGMKVRYRIDGVLRAQPSRPQVNRLQGAIIDRLKIMAGLNVAEKRVPQDGRLSVKVAGRQIDVRISIIPLAHGEGVAMRILDRG